MPVAGGRRRSPPVIGLIAVTGSGRSAAQRLAAAWPGQTRTYRGPARQALPRAWAQCDGLVCFLAVGATVRLIAPLLDSKWTDPAVVCVDESARHAVAVVGGHAAGANALAGRVAAVFGADPVITTATDAVSLPGLDTLGWPTEGAIGPVGRALLDGEQIRLESADTWPLPPLPDTVGAAGDYRIVVTDRVAEAGPRTAILRPPSLVIGVDAAPSAAAGDILHLADSALGEAGLSPASVTALAAASESAGPGLAEAARERGWPVRTGPAAPPGRGGNGRARPGEAAALAAGDEIVVPERAAEGVHLAVARVRPRGRLALVGTGPGARDLLVPRARQELRRASVVAGSGPCLDQVADLLRPGTRMLRGEPGSEAAASREAVALAREGRAVAIAFPADPGASALAGLVLSLAGEDLDVIEVPGITAGQACSAVLGAPLGTGHAVLAPVEESPWPVIEAQARAAAEADFVLTYCMPPGKPEDSRLEEVLDIARRYRGPGTPVAVVRAAQRAEQQVRLATLGDLEPYEVAEQSIVIIGSSRTRVVGGRMITAENGG
jgi:cobalt-precorrin 5A hydrolase / cobalt-factor III methyltransferase / precorrin-3B C17-methyltransferase